MGLHRIEEHDEAVAYLRSVVLNLGRDHQRRLTAGPAARRGSRSTPWRRTPYRSKRDSGCWTESCRRPASSLARASSKRASGTEMLEACSSGSRPAARIRRSRCRSRSPPSPSRSRDHGPYRVIALRKNISKTRGEHVLFDEVRYLFYITTRTR